MNGSLRVRERLSLRHLLLLESRLHKRLLLLQLERWLLKRLLLGWLFLNRLLQKR